MLVEKRPRAVEPVPSGPAGGFLGWIVVMSIVCAACGSPPPPPPPPPPPGEYGSWVADPAAEWPHIAMINQIRYTDSSHPSAACGFLLDTGDGVVAATAKHVLLYFKSGSMTSVSFGGTLMEWKMLPKDDPSRITLLGELINEDPDEALEQVPSGRDWLLFTVVKHADGMQPLRIRTTPLRKGETVYVVGWRYPDQGRQRVLEGRFMKKDGNSVLIDVEALTDNTIPGLSGAPVIDARGYVIGLMSKKAGKLQRLAPVEYPIAVLKEAGMSSGSYP